MSVKFENMNNASYRHFKNYDLFTTSFISMGYMKWLHYRIAAERNFNTRLVEIFQQDHQYKYNEVH